VKVSVILPTYKEPTLESSLDCLFSFLRTCRGHEFEVIVVDDSDDDAFARLAALRDRLAAGDPPRPFRLVRGARRGKGHAVRRGVAHATGEAVFYIDADLPVALAHIPRFLDQIRDGADVVIAERPSRRNLARPVRFLLSFGLLAAQRAFVFHSFEFFDTQCGFKAFRADVLRQVASRQIVDGGMFDIEYLYAAKLNGRRIARNPVAIERELRESKIRLFKCFVLDPLDLVRIKAAGMAGRYRFTDPSSAARGV
jgi:glycosyltransferase involved in cell wall biosynthesis